MSEPAFPYDVFLSHSAKDKAVVRLLAERLRKDGLKVWFDEWEIKPGDSIPAKIEEGLEHSRVLVLCMSANAFGSDWAQLEAGTFRFRDPLNKERRFIPLRLDDAPLKGSLAQFYCIHLQKEEYGNGYRKLVEACSFRKVTRTSKDQTQPLLERAEAAYRLKKYRHAERLSLEAAAEAKKGRPVNKDKIIQAYELAGQSAAECGATVRFLEHFGVAISLVNRNRKPGKLARIYKILAVRLHLSGEYRLAEKYYREAIQFRRRAIRRPHLDMLFERAMLALTPSSQHKFVEEEKELRVALNDSERLLGPDHCDTLGCRSNLATSMFSQGKFLEAEAENRFLLERRAMLLGAKHRDTIVSAYNLTLCLEKQQKLKEARRLAERARDDAREVLGVDDPFSKHLDGLYKHLNS